MACQLQPECNFLHGFFKCKLPIEVVDVEVKVMSMQGTHLYKRVRTMQVAKCVPWTNNICPHPQYHKENENLFGGGEQNGNDHPNIHAKQSI